MLAAGFALALGASSSALAQANWPERPFKLVVGFTPSGAADFVSKAPADGYTLLIASPSAISVNPALDPKRAPAVNSLDFWHGLFVPQGTPPEVVTKLFDATNVALQRPEVKAALAREGTDVSASASPADFAAFVKEENRFWARLAKDSGAKAD